MPFTDEDLKRLKEYTANAKFVSFTHDDVANLLARLEAAEDFIAGRNTIDADLKFEKWRKEAGK